MTRKDNMGQVEDSILRKPKKYIDFRVDANTLDYVCVDCAEYFKHPCVECEDCPVKRLKDRQRYQQEYKVNRPNLRRIK